MASGGAGRGGEGRDGTLRWLIREISNQDLSSTGAEQKGIANARCSYWRSGRNNSHPPPFSLSLSLSLNVSFGYRLLRLTRRHRGTEARVFLFCGDSNPPAARSILLILLPEVRPSNAMMQLTTQPRDCGAEACASRRARPESES